MRWLVAAGLPFAVGLPEKLAAAPAAPDQMKAFEINVCGTRVKVDLHPDSYQPASWPKDLSDEKLRQTGMMEFWHVMYEYKASVGLQVDGRLMVVGTAMRRSEKWKTAGIGFLEIDRVVKFMSPLTPGQVYDTVERDGRTWIRRIKPSTAAPAHGRSVTKEWLVPVNDDILLLFRTELYDSARGRSPAWYASAEAMQNRIFESVHVESPASR